MSQEEIKPADLSVVESKEGDPIRELFLDLGLKIEEIRPYIVRKLRLLNERTKTLEDEKRAIKLARAIFGYYNDKFPSEKFTEIEQKTVLIGTAFTDIGKAGPRKATSKQEKIILDIYAVENSTDPNKTSLRHFFEQYFPKDAIKMASELQEMGLDPNITMREFYNLHARWTLETLSGGGLPQEAVPAAACHHMVEGVNPEGIVGKDGRFTRNFGENVSFDRAEKLIIVLDKYDAARRRGNKDHHSAIGSVRKIIGTNRNFADDYEFETIIARLDQMVSENENLYTAK